MDMNAMNVAINEYKLLIKKVNKGEYNNFEEKVLLMHPQVSQYSEEWLAKKVSEQKEFCAKAVPFIDSWTNEQLIEEFDRFISLIDEYKNVSPSIAADIVWHALMCSGKDSYAKWSIANFSYVLGHDTDDTPSDEVMEKIMQSDSDLILDGHMYMKSSTTCTARCANPCTPAATTCTSRCATKCQLHAISC